MTVICSTSDPQIATQSPPNASHPKAIGIVRAEISGLDASRHAREIRRHAEGLGYRYLYTVRPPGREPDPIGYALAMAVGVGAAAVVVYDLATVGDSPARVCEYCDLETVCPPATWARSLPDPEHAHPRHPLTVPEARRIMQRHIACSAHCCPLKCAALSCLVRAGKVVPPVSSLRERAALRGIRMEPLPSGPSVAGADADTIAQVRDCLVAGAWAQRG